MLATIAPHLVRPARFLAPPPAGFWSGLRMRLGLFARDRFGHAPGRSGQVRLDKGNARGLLTGRSTRANMWSDWLADDSRLAVLNAVDARYRGATIRPRARCIVAILRESAS